MCFSLIESLEYAFDEPYHLKWWYVSLRKIKNSNERKKESNQLNDFKDRLFILFHFFKWICVRMLGTCNGEWLIEINIYLFISFFRYSVLCTYVNRIRCAEYLHACYFSLFCKNCFSFFNCVIEWLCEEFLLHKRFAHFKMCVSNNTSFPFILHYNFFPIELFIEIVYWLGRLNKAKKFKI